MKLEELTHELNLIATAADDHIEALAAQGQLVPVLKGYHTLKEGYKALDEARKRVYHVLDKLEKFHLPAIFDKVGQDKARIPELGRSFYPVTKYSAKMRDKEAGIEWLEENGLGDLVQPTVNAGTLASALKTKLLDEGVEPPEEIMQLTTYYTMGSSKYTPK